MKKVAIIISIIITILAGIGLFFYIKSNNKNNNTYKAERTSTENNVEKSNNKSSENQAIGQQANDTPHTPVEAEELSSFSTKIYTKDSNRQNNINITCSILNNTDVANGETFSFCNTVGQASPSKGYTKADIFINGKKTKGYGGGNCQISTTLYNAVLKVANLKITERHEHSNKVPYIQEGKDAAVSYGSYDFKFINNTGNIIRIKANNTVDEITIKLVKLI